LVGSMLSDLGYDIDIYDFATSGTILDNYGGCYNCYGSSNKGYQDLMNPQSIALNPSDVKFIFIMFGTNHAINMYIANRCQNDLQKCASILIQNLKDLLQNLEKKYTNAVFYIIRPIETFSDGSFLNLNFINETLSQLQTLEDKNKIYYIDLYNEMKKKNFKASETCDTVHPLDNGNYKIAQIIVNQLNMKKMNEKGKDYFYKSFDEGGWGS